MKEKKYTWISAKKRKKEVVGGAGGGGGGAYWLRCPQHVAEDWLTSPNEH